MLSQLDFILSGALSAVTDLSVTLLLVSLFFSSTVDFDPRSDIFTENFLRSSTACVSSSRTTFLVREEDGVQRLPVTDILGPGEVAGGSAEEEFSDREMETFMAPEKALSVLIDATVGALSNPEREKAVTVYPREFLPMDVCS